MRLLQALLLTVSLAFVNAATAVPITFIHSGSGAGSIDGTPFALSDFVITALGDTDDKQNQGGFADFIDHLSASIAIDGVGTFQLVTGTRTFLNGQVVGFSRAGDGGLDLFNGPSDAALLGWDMASSIGPVSGIGSLLQWLSDPVITDGGQLIFDSAQTEATFQAIVPAPAPLALLGLGLLGAGLARQRTRTA